MNKTLKAAAATVEKTALLSGFAIAVVEPEFGINLGYLVRIAANFGMKKVLIVSGKRLDEENLSRAALFAAHGRQLVENLEYVDSVKKLRKKFKILVGTTAIEAKRRSNLTRRNYAPEECAQLVFERLTVRKQKRDEVCFVFGRDTTGLTNEELRECDYSLTIRTHSSYNTLNISHAAAVIFYVFSNPRNGVGQTSNHLSAKVSKPVSSRKEKDRVISLFLRLAEESEFQPFKQDLLKQTLERLLNRSDPSLRELYLLMGLASKAGSKINRLSTRPLP